MTVPFKKILIANRGEIACRIIRTCRKMGIATVAVYSEADRDALHVDMADEAVCIGPPPASESYLRIDRIVAAAKDTGAEAVHPGFGFLAENPAFVTAVEEAGLVFIGPPASAIAAMGDKIESKRLAREAGVNVVPGFLGEIADADEAVRIAREIGYPVMIKASAGGGGKGMRIAHDDAACREGFARARSEAKSSFGDERVFIEKYIEEPRHIEIQVLGDKAGTVLYLGERECSIQRRHQKVIEEAPSPFVTPEMRAAMGAQAVALAKAVGYHSAGTVEFIVDKDRNFYFLEMNTRLQVEHPVTEMVTGLDLVEWMIRIAAGEQLAFTQAEVAFDGWALECRIYAEDPFRNFLPSIGRLTHYREPPDGERHIRVDSGVREGDEITMFYDPMIAKLVTWGADRDEAIARMIHALDAFYICGIRHNIPFLSAVVEHPRFREGRLSTNFIAEEYPDGFHGAPLTAEKQRILIITAVYAEAVERSRASSVPGKVMEPPAVAGRPLAVLVGPGEAEAEAVLVPTDAGATITIGDRRHAVETGWTPGNPVFEATIDGQPVTVEVDRSVMGWRVATRGVSREVLVLDKHVADLMRFMPERQETTSAKELRCPMPGVVVAVAVAEGEEVKAGEPLVTVEAMKMENILRAERDGVVKVVHVKPGDNLAVDQVILEFA